MVIDSFQAGILECLRKQKARIGSVALTLFLASVLHLMVQPCLMAAPVEDCHAATLHHHQTVLSSGSAAALSYHSEIQLPTSVDCRLMQGCADWDSTHSVIPSHDLEKKYVATVELQAQIQPEPIYALLPPVDLKPLFSRVPLFIQNCAFLI